MGEIRILEPSVVSKIAAGEVVERPAAALKELVENSIDSGARQIRISIIDGGITELVVSDDGQGMGAEDLGVAVQPHATSKLTMLDDLETIGTLGFRGEALAAISSLSNMTIRSRRRDAENGHELKLHGSWDGEKAVPCVMAPGTEISVRDIFANAPGRRKFLRKPQTEWAYCEVVAQTLAMGNPGICFEMQRDGKKKVRWEPKSEQERVHDVLGPRFSGSAVEFSDERGPLWLHGYVDVEGLGSRARQFIYLNGRAISDRLVKQAVRKAIKDMLKGPDVPYVLFLTVPGQMVDVNAHPSKLEVRFKEPNAIFALVNSAIEKVTEQPLGVNPGISLGYLSSEKGKGDKGSPVSDKLLAGMAAKEKMEKAPGRRAGLPPAPATTRPSAAAPFREGMGEGPGPEPPRDLGRVVGILHGIYLLSETEQGMMVIDVHAAHERIIYEELKDKAKIKIQELLAPIELDIPPVAMDTISEHRELLAKAGLIVKNVDGVETLQSVPHLLADRIEDPAALVNECLEDIAETGKAFAVEEVSNKILATMACHAAVRGSNPFLGDKNLDALLRKMEKTLRSGRCNHGRPCWRLISMTELDRNFERGR